MKLAIVLENNVFKGNQCIFVESISSTIVSFSGHPLQTPLLSKYNKTLRNPSVWKKKWRVNRLHSLNNLIIIICPTVKWLIFWWYGFDKMYKINQKFGFLVSLVILCKKMVKYENLLFFSFEETWIPLTEGCFVSNWLKFAQWFWRRWFF